MKNPFSRDTSNPTPRNSSTGGFTLMETVIAIGVLAVLLSGFIAVFAPAAQGIKRAVNSQQADRLASTLEKELVTLREGQSPTTAETGFEKAFQWIEQGDRFSRAILVYQYRGDNNSARRTDGSLQPLDNISGEPGVDYTVVSMVRRMNVNTPADQELLEEDFGALEGTVFYVKTNQLVYNGTSMTLSSTPDEISDPRNPNDKYSDSALYPDAVIAFSAEFYSVPTKSIDYLGSDAFRDRYNNFDKPVFTRNLAVRR